MTKSKYCFDYCESVEKLLDETLAAIANDVRSGPASGDIAFLVLGGGYGRGEGGINRDDPQNPSLYNDLDFFVIAKNDASRRGLNAFFREMSKKWTKKMGIDVDFGPAETCEYISERLNMMMWREMVMAGNVVVGDKTRFKKIFKIKSLKMPPSETAKLMLNRIYGLFLAGRKLCEPPRKQEDFDFIARNINKSVLASVESVLMSMGIFEFKTEDRMRSLNAAVFEDAEFKRTLVSAYEKAADFKRTPYHSTDMASLWTRYEAACSLAQSALSKVECYINSREPIVKILKNFKKNLALRKLFSSIDVRCNPLVDPVLPAISLLSKNLSSPCSVDEQKFLTIKNIWKNIN